MASSGSDSAAQRESNPWLAQALPVQLRENLIIASSGSDSAAQGESNPWLAQALTVQSIENLIHS